MTDSGHSEPAEGDWQPDPTGRYKMRWQLSTGEWTHWVWTADGKRTTDPVAQPETVPTSGASGSAGSRAPVDHRHEERVSSQEREPRMPEFLTTAGVSYHLEEIIKRAKTSVLLISPYLKTNDRIREVIEARSHQGLDIRIVYGKKEIDPKEQAWIDSVPTVHTAFCENLHAKCYLNERTALLTSMNLYEFSQVNNTEMGILVDRDDADSLFKQISDEAESIWQRNANREQPKTQELRRNTGHCIRCKTSIVFNLKKPHCGKCYKIWSKYKNPQYEEQFCHNCGAKTSVTAQNPACMRCFKKTRKKSSQ